MAAILWSYSAILLAMSLNKPHLPMVINMFKGVNNEKTVFKFNIRFSTLF